MHFERSLAMYRDHLVGEGGRFVLQPRRQVSLPAVSNADVYIHIPFCNSLCPYCPYNRVLYDRRLAKDYEAAMIREIDGYYEALGPIETGSIYIGGGTPTTMMDGLASALERIRSRFPRSGAVAVESIPTDLDASRLRDLRDMGVTLLSIGIQSFDDRFLKLIGRGYRSDILEPVIDQAIATGFESVNIDLMFALPGQSTAAALADLDRAIELGAPQITLYPLFTFPYSTVGRYRRLEAVGFPGLAARRRMYRAIHNRALEQGFERVSVWGFKRRDTETFSSVTRDRFIGIGAGSATHLDGVLYFNTFSIPEYSRACMAGKPPIALTMSMSRMMENFYWLYWRIYETSIPKDGLQERFAGDREVQQLFRIALFLNLLVEDEQGFRLTERGAFWIHLLQNYYVLNYINTVWTTAMRQAWPGRIDL